MSPAEKRLTTDKAHAYAILTGASQGIGRAILRALEHNGYPVLALSRSKPEACGSQITWQQLDLSDGADISKCVSDLEISTIRALILCAADYGVGQRHPAAATSTEEWQRVIGTNCTGHCILVSCLLPKLIASSPGIIINLSSDVVLLPGTGRSAYAASKAGLHAMLRAVATENSVESLRVYQLIPTFQLDTYGIRHRRPAGFDFSSYGDPAIIAEVVNRILSPTDVTPPGTYLVRRDGRIDPFIETTQI